MEGEDRGRVGDGQDGRGRLGDCGAGRGALQGDGGAVAGGAVQSAGGDGRAEVGELVSRRADIWVYRRRCGVPAAGSLAVAVMVAAKGFDSCLVSCRGCSVLCVLADECTVLSIPSWLLQQVPAKLLLISIND